VIYLVARSHKNAAIYAHERGLELPPRTGDREAWLLHRPDDLRGGPDPQARAQGAREEALMRVVKGSTIQGDGSSPYRVTELGSPWSLLRGRLELACGHHYELEEPFMDDPIGDFDWLVEWQRQGVELPCPEGCHDSKNVLNLSGILPRGDRVPLLSACRTRRWVVFYARGPEA
jgi:hypothetical protein